MNINNFDLSKAELVKPIVYKNNGSLRDLGGSVLKHKKTKVYLINEFNFDNQDMAVIIVEYWFGVEAKFFKEMLIVDKKCIRRILSKF